MGNQDQGTSWIENMSQNTKKADTSWVKNKWLDIPYASQSESQKLDIYLPEEGEGPFPVIVAIHGGAFAKGAKTDDEIGTPIKCIKDGYAVISVEYRLSGEAEWPLAVHDIKAAIRWLRANAGKYKLDSKKFATWGGSAGGYYAAAMGTTANLEEFEDKTMGNPDQPSDVQAVIAWFGTYDMVVMDQQFQNSTVTPQIIQDPNDKTSYNAQLMGGALASVPDKVVLANPANHITRKCPPFFLQHGDIDFIVPHKQSIDMTERLKSIVPSSTEILFETLKGQTHMGDGFYTEENRTKVVAFLDKHLK